MAKDAEVATGVLLTGGTFLDKGVRVDSNARIHHSVVLADTHVGSSAHVENSFVGRGVRIGSGARLTNAAIGDGVVIDDGEEVPEGARVSAS